MNIGRQSLSSALVAVAAAMVLKQDRPALLAVKERLTAASPERARLVDKFIENFGSSYADALLWHRLSPTIASCWADFGA